MLWWLWHTRGYLSEGRDWLAQVLDMDAEQEHTDSSVFRAKALRGAGTLAAEQGDYAAAAAFAEESVAILRELEDKSLAGALDTLARAVLARGDEPRATGLYRKALTIAHEASEKRIVALFLEGTGRCASVRGDAPHAARLYGASSALREDIVTPLSATEEADYAPYIEATRRELDEDTFTAAWRADEVRALEQAVASALID